MADVLQGISPARIFKRPTADEVWPGPAQASALARLEAPAGAIALIGPRSSGRSTLLRALPASLGPRTLVLAPAGGQRSGPGLLASLLDQAQLAPTGLSEVDQRNLLALFIQQRHAQGYRIVLAVDDADQLDGSVWCEIERLAALARQREPVLGLVLTLTDPADESAVYGGFLAALGTEAVAPLTWLAPEDVQSYIRWRMRRAGLDDIFTPTAAHLIGRCTEGRFAAIDHLCQMALLMLRAGGHHRVDVPLVIAATRQMKERHTVPGQQSSVPHSPAMPAVSPPRLVVSYEGQVVERCVLRDRLLIGRGERNDLSLQNSFLSRYHAVIMRTPQGYYITDLDSANGVFVNGQEVESSLLEDQDLIILGPYRLKVELGDGTRLDDEDSLDDTAIMPIAPNPQHLRVIKRA